MPSLPTLSAFKFMVWAAVSLLLLSPTAHAKQLLVSNKPLALIAAVVYPTDNIQILIPDGTSPHDFTLRPSDMRKIRNADKVLWSGPMSEPFLEKLVDQRWISATQIAQSIQRFDPEDGHVWLQPQTAIAVAKYLAGQDEGRLHAAMQFEERVLELIYQSIEQLAPFDDRDFYVFHDAYGYWFDQIQVQPRAAVSATPEHKPGARHVHNLHTEIKDGQIHCVLTEPHFKPALITKLIRNRNVKTAAIDPLASHISLNSNGYIVWLTEMVNILEDCIAP